MYFIIDDTEGEFDIATGKTLKEVVSNCVKINGVSEDRILELIEDQSLAIIKGDLISVTVNRPPITYREAPLKKKGKC